VRLYRLDHFSYWLDEVMQGFWIQGDWNFFWKSLRFDAVHPPLDYLVSRAVETLAPANWERKLPAVFWGTATITVFGALVARRAGRVVGLLAALLMACAPFHVRYSQEFRPYALGVFGLCLSLLCLDWYLERRSVGRLASLYFVCLATAYTLYLAAVVLGLAALAMLIEDSFAPESERRHTARRFLLASPLFATALFLAYLPWWPVALEAWRRPPGPLAEPVTWQRVGRTLSFFAFAHDDGDPFRWGTALWTLLLIGGAVLAFRGQRLRFFLVWGFGGLLLVEILGQLHPHWYASRRFVPAGVGMTVLISLAIARLGTSKRALWLAMAALAACLVFDARGLTQYFREGRPDWRPLAEFLRSRPRQERIFTENQYSELCVAFYVEGSQWLYRRGRLGRDVWNLDGEMVRLTWSWLPGRTAWLVLAGDPQYRPLRAWAKELPKTVFPSAEGGAVLVTLDPAMRETVLMKIQGR